MKIQELAKKTGLKLAAIIVIGGVLMFTFTGCGNKPAEPVMSESVSVETVVETAEEDLGTVAGGLYAEDAEIADGQEAEISEEYTIDFVDAGNEDIEAEQGATITIPEYERQKLINLIPTVFDSFNPESEDFEVLDTVENEDGTTTYHVALASSELTNNVTTQYSVDIETGKAKALFVYQVPMEIEVPAEDFGLTFEITQAEDGTVTVDKIVDLYGNEVTDEITLYAGNCIGWSMTKWATDAVDFEFEDEISVSQDLNMYPVMDLTHAAKEGEDLTQGVWVLSYNGTAIRMTDNFDGTTVTDVYQVKEGKLIDSTGKTVVDEESGVVTTATTKTETAGTAGESSGSGAGTGSGSGSGTGAEQSSTTGGVGHTESTEGGGHSNVPDEPVSTGNIQDAAAKFGMSVGTGTTNPNSTGGEWSQGITWG